MADFTIATTVLDRFKAIGGKRINIVNVVFDGGTYVTGGIALTAGQCGLSKLDDVLFMNGSGFLPDWDAANGKIKLYHPQAVHSHAGSVAMAAGKTSVVKHDAAPGGNQIYVKFDEHGAYLCCNMATDTADKGLLFGADTGVIIKHDADAATGHALTCDGDGVQPDRLIADFSGAGNINADVYIPTSHPLRYLKVKNGTNGGVALNFDDGADDRLEATLSPAADSTIDLCIITGAAAAAGSAGAEIGNGGTVGAITLRIMALGV